MDDLRHLQNVITMIAKDFDSFCKKNGINYFLLGGSAIGAVRHKGFIPWDDDLDVGMDSENYSKFLSLCRNGIDPNKYYIQEGYIDWPMPYTKIKLRGTVFNEPGQFSNPDGECGIFMDVFKLENAPNSKVERLWQYFCAKYLLCYCLLERGWAEASVAKRVLMSLASPLKIHWLRSFFREQVEMWKKKETEYCSLLCTRFKYKKSFYKKDWFRDIKYVPFEDTELPIPEGYDEWLTMVYGDYMTPPPVRERVGLHLQGVDFGKY